MTVQNTNHVLAADQAVAENNTNNAVQPGILSSIQSKVSRFGRWITGNAKSDEKPADLSNHHIALSSPAAASAVSNIGQNILAEDISFELDEVLDDKPITPAIIKQIQDKPDNLKTATQMRLVEIMKELKNHQVTNFEVDFDLASNNGQVVVEPYVTCGIVRYKVEGEFKVKFQLPNGTQEEITLKRTIYTMSGEPKKAIAAAQYFGVGCAEIALHNQSPGGERKLEFSDDEQSAKLLNQTSLAVSFKKDVYGHSTVPKNLRVGKDTKLKFKANAYHTKTFEGVKRKTAKIERDEVFNTEYTVMPTKFSEKDFHGIYESINPLKEKLEETKKEFGHKYVGWNPLKRNIFRRKKNGVAQTSEFRNLLGDLRVIENKDLTASGSSKEAKSYQKLRKQVRTLTEKQTQLSDELKTVSDAKKQLKLDEMTQQIEASKKEMTNLEAKAKTDNDKLIAKYYEMKKSLEQFKNYRTYALNLTNIPNLSDEKRGEVESMLASLEAIITTNEDFINKIGAELNDQSLNKSSNVDKTSVGVSTQPPAGDVVQPAVNAENSGPAAPAKPKLRDVSLDQFDN